MEIIKLQTRKRQESIGCSGFRYRKEKTFEKIGHISWRCREKSCKGRLLTNLDLSSPRETSEHNHLSNPEGVLAERSISHMFLRASTESIPIPVIYKEETAKFVADNHFPNEPELNPVLPPFPEVRSSLYRARRRNFPPLPQTITAIEIPENLSQSLSGARFLLVCDKQQGILLFATDNNLQLLAESKLWCMDGTFDVC